MLDTTCVHLGLCRRRFCWACKTVISATHDDIVTFFDAKGVEVVRWGGKGAAGRRGRRKTLHTPAFILSCYTALQRTVSGESLRAAYLDRLWLPSFQYITTQVAGSTPGGLTPCGFAYKMSFVPHTAYLMKLLKAWHNHFVAPQVRAARIEIAKRTRVWKLDGHYKAATKVRQEKTSDESSQSKRETCALVLMNEEGYLCMPPVLRRGESAEDFEAFMGPQLDLHYEANKDAPDEGVLIATLSDDYDHHAAPVGHIFLKHTEGRAAVAFMLSGSTPCIVLLACTLRAPP